MGERKLAKRLFWSSHFLHFRTELMRRRVAQAGLTMRLLRLAIASPAVALAQSASASPKLPEIFTLDGIKFGQRAENSIIDERYDCNPSRFFEGYRWCQSKDEPETDFGFRQFSFYASSEGRVAIVLNTITHAMIKTSNLSRLVEEIRSNQGRSPQYVETTVIDGNTKGEVYYWGEGSLDRLSGEEIKEVYARPGLYYGNLLDLISDTRRSAKNGLPIYRMNGSGLALA